MLRSNTTDAARALDALPEACGDDIVAAAEAIITSLRSQGHLWLFGNGGSASDAQHIACELAGRFIQKRKPLAATALTTNTSSLTAIGNDYGYEHIFTRQLEGVARSGDVALGISTSGSSANVVLALQAAASMGVRTIGLTGRPGRRVAEVSEITIRVPSDNTQRIQECHIAVGHTLCQLVEETLFP